VKLVDDDPHGFLGVDTIVLDVIFPGGTCVISSDPLRPLAHHEWGGETGYPQGFLRASIPLESHIVAIADVYAALHSARSHKPAFQECIVLDIMQNKVGSHVDSAVCR
jgi:HD-GYP domain-containing protein (c-di-GMP phosphodiesterase class II)